MVPVVTRAPNITNISCWKIAPMQTTRVYWSKNSFELHLYLVKQFKIEFRCLIYQSVPHCLKFYHCVSASPIIKKVVKFFRSFVDSSIGTICHHKDFTGRVPLWENSFRPETTFFTHKEDFFWQGTDTQMDPICSKWYSQSDRRKILEPPWSALDTKPHGPKTMDIAPSVG